MLFAAAAAAAVDPSHYHTRLLFPAQISLITDMLGTPSDEDIDQIRTDKARTYIRALPQRAKVCVCVCVCVCACACVCVNAESEFGKFCFVDINSRNETYDEPHLRFPAIGTVGHCLS